MINFNYSALLSYYDAKSGGGLASTALAGTAAGKQAPKAPWSMGNTLPTASERVKAALAHQPILDVDRARKTIGKGNEDYAELFGLYSALETLKALAERRDVKDLPAIERAQIERKFTAGLTQVGDFIDGLDMERLRLVRGNVSESAKTLSGVKVSRPEYRTGIIHQGTWDMPVDSLGGDVRFSMKVTIDGGAVRNIDFDLAEMGTTERTLGEVVKYMNGKLEAAGVGTRFDREKLPGEKRTVQVGARTVTLPDGPERWSLKIAGLSTEALSFSAPDSADALFMGQTQGKDGARTQNLTKLQTDAVVGAPADAYAISGERYRIEGQVFARALDTDIAAVRASATHSDGSVYMLAEVTGAVDDQAIKGERDVALLKYDAAGNLVFSRTLGAASEANASAIAVAADGTVAIGGSVKGALGGTESTDTVNADSFVTVFNGDGEEVWTQRGVSSSADSVKALTFGADGTLYVSGQVDGSLLTESPSGGTDSWLRAYRTADIVQEDGSTRVGAELVFSTQYGTAGADTPIGIAVEGTTLVAAGIEDGHAVVRRFDLQPTGDPVLAATQNLGHLSGGALTGVGFSEGRIVVAGSTNNTGLTAATTLNAHSGGGHDVFVASFDTALTAGSATVSYWGGTGQEQVTAVSIGAGGVYVGGSSTEAFAGQVKFGDKDGFVARFDLATGAAEWSRRFTGTDGETAPTTLAVAAGGASVLDRLGLPTGSVDYTGSQLITAATSARAGDRFYVSTGTSGRRVAVTLDADETLKTLAAKVTRALGYTGKAEVVREGVGPAAVERLVIKPRSERTSIEIQSGEGSRDLLEAVGLEEGVVRTIARDRKGKEIVPRDGKTWGLKLARDLSLDSKAEIKRTIEELGDASTVVQLIYRDLTNALKPDKPAITGTAPAYMQARIANYAAGLARLTGGG